MTVVALYRAANSAEQLLLKAVALSLAIHLAAFGGWKWGRSHLAWKPLALPAWLAVNPRNPPTALARILPAAQTPQPPPLVSIYVDVSPAQAVPQPPVNPKFYSTDNTLAANTEIKVPSTQPQLNGTQNNVVKTVAPAPRPVAPQPAPKPVLQPPLQPAPPDVKKPETAATETAGNKPPPKPASTSGELAEARPAPKPVTAKGTSETANGASATQPASDRPRTLAEARAQQGAPGPKSRQEGGVNRLALDPSVDAMRTVYGDYDRDFIDAVQTRWYALLKDRQDEVAGKVVLEFNLHADGRISDMKMKYTDVNELLTLICQQAVLDPSLYKPWPAQMIAVIKDPRPIRFTFYYSY
jgi:hypothetical protein